MKRLIIPLAAAAFLLIGQHAFAQKMELSDPQIASAAVTANQIDVNYGKVALKHSTNKTIREFAQTMINDHNAIIAKAVALAQKLNVTPKDNPLTQSLLSGEKTTIKMLNSKKGAAFDKAYIDNEVAYHEAVINAVKTILVPQSDNAELKELLQQVEPLLNEHLEHAKMVQSKIK